MGEAGTPRHKITYLTIHAMCIHPDCTAMTSGQQAGTPHLIAPLTAVRTITRPSSIDNDRSRSMSTMSSQQLKLAAAAAAQQKARSHELAGGSSSSSGSSAHRYRTPSLPTFSFFNYQRQDLNQPKLTQTSTRCLPWLGSPPLSPPSWINPDPSQNRGRHQNRRRRSTAPAAPARA